MKKHHVHYESHLFVISYQCGVWENLTQMTSASFWRAYDVIVLKKHRQAKMARKRSSASVKMKLVLSVRQHKHPDKLTNSAS